MVIVGGYGLWLFLIVEKRKTEDLIKIVKKEKILNIRSLIDEVERIVEKIQIDDPINIIN
ncbi:MAG: hypothetical protein JRJ23_07890 [Deltaproteobacteria bacterium]|nr:hypothetical protein [Deltaproteobacteria bacterium]MBW1914037.1 hypothetical protein [Deltaproteobacteria bacterium]